MEDFLILAVGGFIAYKLLTKGAMTGDPRYIEELQRSNGAAGGGIRRTGTTTDPRTGSQLTVTAPGVRMTSATHTATASDSRESAGIGGPGFRNPKPGVEL